MKLIIGIDDTDNLESRGTGFLARKLAQSLESEKMVSVENITRHQLLVSPEIPYTSHNSSASIVVQALTDIQIIINFCRTFLLCESADGSDVGLCVAEYDKINPEVIEWGNRAKNEILIKDNAHKLAEKENIYLEGLTGKKIGVIGSLAAVGLRVGGNDGRILWLRNLRETTGVYSAKEIYNIFAIDKIVTDSFEQISETDLISLTEWTRPIVRDNAITLIVENSTDYEKYKYTVASKNFIKSITE